MNYRKKPIVIEAVQWDGENFDEIRDFTGNAAFFRTLRKADDERRLPEWKELVIKTLEGEMIVSKNDYIIKGIHGEYYPCKPDIFRKT